MINPSTLSTIVRTVVITIIEAVITNATKRNGGSP